MKWQDNSDRKIILAYHDAMLPDIEKKTKDGVNNVNPELDNKVVVSKVEFEFIAKIQMSFVH